MRIVEKLKEKAGKGTAVKALRGMGVAVGVFAVFYGCGVFYYSERFLEGTRINGTECENMLAREADQLLKKEAEKYQLQVLFREEKEEIIKAEDIDFAYELDYSSEKLLKEQNPFLWIKGLWQERELHVGYQTSYHEEKLRSKMDSFACMKEENMTPPENAYIAFENNQFIIQEETQGTQLDKEAFLEKAGEAVRAQKKEISAEDSGVYIKAQIDKNNPDLLKKQQVYNSCAAVTVTYTFGENQVVLDGMTVKDWMSYDEAGNYVEDDSLLLENIEIYVENLGAQYNTVGRTRTITSTATGQPVSVEGGSYGFLIDQEGEEAQLLADIRGHVNTVREPIYSRRGAVYGEQDFGSTYVEVDLTGQHLWYYKDGAVLMESDFVSGTYYNRGRRTPGGSYYLYYKQRNQVLRPAPNPDGSYDYESPVSYWMPFNGGIGFHDANWRWSFGGNIYLYSGSHGCINLPVSFAGGFYDSLEPGCPVICFYR